MVPLLVALLLDHERRIADLEAEVQSEDDRRGTDLAHAPVTAVRFDRRSARESSLDWTGARPPGHVDSEEDSRVP
jgi:hypothetical protein